ncbi:MAG: hypothetical protein MJ245_03475 [Clostridia bacterium]|nr:hypothetical protein [Clostridia bacterium]
MSQFFDDDDDDDFSCEYHTSVEEICENCINYDTNTHTCCYDEDSGPKDPYNECDTSHFWAK